MKIRGTILVAIIMTLISGCKNEEIMLNALNSFQETKYYSSEIMPESYNNAYGTWKVENTSGGFSGVGYKKDFDYLLLKKNGIFGVLRNDSLIAYGKMIVSQDKVGLLCKFDSEKSANIELCYDSEKYIQLINNDSLVLYAPCCDRYNIHFKLQK